MEFINEEIFTLVVLPILIFLARTLDVSLGTIRIIFIAKGFKYLAPLIGFVEILIWLVAIGQIFQNLNSVSYYLAYAGGFAMGNFVGIWLDSKLLLGTQIIRVITAKDTSKLVKALKESGYGVTTIDAQGVEGEIKIVYTIVSRYDLRQIVKIIKEYNPYAFYSIEDVRFVSDRVFTQRKPFLKKHYRNLFKLNRKGK